MQNPELRRRVQTGLNKGEARNALARAVFFNRLGELRDRSYDNQRHRASGLNLLTAAITLWNTVYLEHAITTTGHPSDDPLLDHLSPLGWEHINLTGDYAWNNPPPTQSWKTPPPAQARELLAWYLFRFVSWSQPQTVMHSPAAADYRQIGIVQPAKAFQVLHRYLIGESTGIPPIQQPPTPKREFPYRSSPNPRSALRSPCIVEELRFKGILGAPFDPTHR